MTDQETDTDPSRAFARALFGAAQTDDETDEPDEQQKPPGYSAREGNIPKTPPDDGMRTYVRDLFGLDPNS